ncbi:ribonuclease HI [Candidatus Latescibacterota bacterium]
MIHEKIKIYTDGGCSPNPGLGGWAAILISPSHNNYTREISGSEPDSTNNRMELTAAIMALKTLKNPSDIELYTDSQYLKNAFTQGWLDKWTRNGWKSSGKKAVKNIDLWKELIELSDKHTIEWKWIKGHSNNHYNERCDELVLLARKKHSKRKV